MINACWTRCAIERDLGCLRATLRLTWARGLFPNSRRAPSGQTARQFTCAFAKEQRTMHHAQLSFNSKGTSCNVRLRFPWILRPFHLILMRLSLWGNRFRMKWHRLRIKGATKVFPLILRRFHLILKVFPLMLKRCYLLQFQGGSLWF